MNRRDFLKFSAFAAAGAPLGAKAIEKPMPPFPDSEKWPEESWAGAYVPEDFVFVKPSVHIIGTNKVGIWWKTKYIATGWAEASQDGGKTWRKYWYEQDGVCNTNATTHMAVIDDYDSSKPLKIRVINWPIAETGRFGQVRYVGENIPDVTLQNYYIGGGYTKFYKSREKKYTGKEYVEEVEISAIDPNGFNIVMFNDTHHGLPLYEKLCQYAPKKTAIAVFAGDILDHARSEVDFDKHLSAPMAYVGKRLKCLTRFARGNHDLMGRYAQFVRNHVVLQDNAYYGALTIGKTRIAILDTGIPGYKPSWAMDFFGMNSYMDRQNAWLLKETASDEWKKAKNRVAFSHIPPVLDGKNHPSDKNIDEKVYGPLMKDLSLLMSAHWHSGRFHNPSETRPFPMAIGGGPHANARSPTGLPTLTVLSVKSDAMEVYQINYNGDENFRVKV